MARYDKIHVHKLDYRPESRARRAHSRTYYSRFRMIGVFLTRFGTELVQARPLVQPNMPPCSATSSPITNTLSSLLHFFRQYVFYRLSVCFYRHLLGPLSRQRNTRCPSHRLRIRLRAVAARTVRLPRRPPSPSSSIASQLAFRSAILSSSIFASHPLDRALFHPSLLRRPSSCIPQGRPSSARAIGMPSWPPSASAPCPSCACFIAFLHNASLIAYTSLPSTV